MLTDIGWSDEHRLQMKGRDGLVPGRIIAQHRGSYNVMSELGELRAEVSGRMRHEALGPQNLPAVGDWVALAIRGAHEAGTIHDILPRRTKFSRKVAGVETEEQVLAANIDTIFVIASLNAELNARRIERYLALGWQSGAMPVVVLTKADMIDDVAGDVAEVAAVAGTVAVHAVSALTGWGMDDLLAYFTGGRTVALLGSSGVGKSTLVNALVGAEVQRVTAIRSDDKGRHTTTHRELIALPTGGAVIDTPGMRELQLWDADEGMTDAFQDIETLALECRFRDCSHQREPECAVAEALADGRLAHARYNGYLKLQRELRYLSRKKDARARAAETRKWKAINRDHRAATRARRT